MAKLNVPMVFSLEEARAAGVRKDEVYELLSLGVVKRIGRGVYQQNLELPNDSVVAAGVTLVRPEATLCLQSALAHHGLLDDAPQQHHIAVPRGKRFPAGFHDVAWHSFDKATYGAGRLPHVADVGLEYSVYSAERTLLDSFRLIHLVGESIARSALLRWFERPGSNVDDLKTLAASLPGAVAKIIPIIVGILPDQKQDHV
ncbi:MAG: hypothetical protein Q4A92_06770 [Corynebacterium sp.]|nr:hypothetical protein [Corynebacterium sp.]